MNPSLRSVALFATLLYVFHLVTCDIRETFMITGATGDEVIEDMASKIETLNIFKDKPIKEFLKRIYYFNDHTPGSLDIYKVTDNDIKDLRTNLINADAIEKELNISMSHVTLENMTIPLYHGIVIISKVIKGNDGYKNLDEQAKLFGKIYDDASKNGKYEDEFKRYGSKDKCKKNLCKNNGVCIIGEDPPKCICKVPYHGQICQRKASTCIDGNIKCDYGGRCVKDENKNLIECKCFAGSTGRQCTIDAIKCSDIECENGGTCYEPISGYPRCKCTDKYEGNYCEIKKPDEADGGKKSSASMLPYTSVLSFVTVVLSYALI